MRPASRNAGSSRDQFELIGEHVMGRMLGSTTTHEAMNQQMRGMMGASGEARAHVFMGQRFTACASASAPAAFHSMMGMMGGYAGANGGMMGNGRRGGDGFGPGMMGRSGSRAGGSWSDADSVIVILGVLLVGVLGALAAWRPWRRSSAKTPLDFLNDRLARGEIDSAEHQQLRPGLGGLKRASQTPSSPPLIAPFVLCRDVARGRSVASPVAVRDPPS